MRRALLLAALAVAPPAAARAQAAADTTPLLLVPAAVWDGVADAVQPGWVVLLRGDRIVAAGPPIRVEVPAGTERVELPGSTLMPGLIEGHSHLFLHPYDETLWDDQVLKEPAGYRMAAAVAHAEATVRAGVTTTRDLGTEGVADYDVQLKRAIERGVVPGPRILATTRAIVATGTYAPRHHDYAFEPPIGAQEASGVDEVTRVVREQLGRGADWIKVYADFGYGPAGGARPAFSQEELDAIVRTARDGGAPVVAHASSPEGMRRAVLAGVTTIEHGDGGTPEIWALMRERGVALCPTLAASEAYARYFGGWNGEEPAPESLARKRDGVRRAMAAGVPICFGGDAGVFPHGENVRELELLVELGMTPLAAARAATSGNAAILGLEDWGRIAPEMLADLIAVEGDPTREVGVLRRVNSVFLGGRRSR